MAYSLIEYTTDGGVGPYSIPFQYIDKTHVEVYVAGALKTLGTHYTFPTSSTVQFLAGQTAGQNIQIRRNTPKGARLVNYQDASVLTEADLDRDSDQCLFVSQEAFDAVDSALIRLGTDGTFDAANHRLKNVSNPVNPQDAATRAWVEGAATSQAAQALASAANAATSEINAAASAAAAAQSASALANVLPEKGNYADLRSYTGPLAAFYVRGAANIFDGGHGVFRVDPTDVSSADNSGTVLVDATGRRWKREYAGSVNVRWFGAKGDGVADDLLAFQRASAFKAVYMPVGTYKISGTVSISLSGSHWFGEGIYGTVISSSSASLAMFSLSGGISGVTLEDFQLTRSVTALSGGDGVTCSTVTLGQAKLRRLLVQQQFNGLSLGPTDYSIIVDVISQQNQNDGLVLINTATNGTLQWSIDRLLVQKNGGRGLIVQTVAGVSTISLGTWRDVNTYANTGHGVAVVGDVGRAIFGLRWVVGFSGENGGSSVYLDTYGEGHRISNVQTELAGAISTGPTLSTPATNMGSGFEVTGNNIGIVLSECDSNGHSYDGYVMAAGVNVLNGCKGTNNGLASVAGRRNGVNHTGGRLTVTGGQYGNTQGSTSQLYGALSSNGDNLTVVGADLTNNATGPVSCTTNYTYATLVGNRPNTMDVGLSPAGQVLVGGGATGGYKPAGTINVAGGLYKQNVAYTNP